MFAARSRGGWNNERSDRGHLARFIPTGEIALEQLVPTNKVEPIRQAILKFNETGALSQIKEYLGDDYSYGEIRAVIASM